MTCCPYGIQGSKKSRRNSLFPEASRMVLSRYRSSTCCCSSEFRPSGHSKYILPAHLRLVLLGFPHFTATESHNKTNATRRTAWKKFALAERQRARNFLIFRCGCKQETLGCKRLKIKRRISFATRLISLRPSHANFDFLFSNLAVRDFMLFTLDFNT